MRGMNDRRQKQDSSGRQRKREWTAALREAIAANPGCLREIADKLILAAKAGDTFAIREIGDRLDGKPCQAVEVSSADDVPTMRYSLTLAQLQDIAAGILPTMAPIASKTAQDAPQSHPTSKAH